MAPGDLLALGIALGALVFCVGDLLGRRSRK